MLLIIVVQKGPNIKKQKHNSVLYTEYTSY